MKPSNRRDFLHMAARWSLASGSIPLAALFLHGCKTMGAVADIGTAIGTSTGTISESQAESIRTSAYAVARSFEDFTPEQEYYIGRSVGAEILETYPPYEDPALNRYVNLLGQTLAQMSDRPETFSGYRFLIQDSDDINALSAPGGFIFVTRGMLRCCRSEDALAATLAHEIGHVQAKHGLQAIKQARVTEALTTIGLESAKTFGGEELAQLTRTFESSIADITRTLITNGYSRELEGDADAAAVTIMRRVGYDPNALIDMLTVMSQQLVPGRLDFARTHPTPAARMSAIQPKIGAYRPVSLQTRRQRRFQNALESL